MISNADAEARVTRGALYLDSVRPNWFKEIIVETLELKDPCCCIIGQLTGGWYPNQLGIGYRDSIWYGMNLDEPGWEAFSIGPFGGTMRQWYQPLQNAWIAAIATRLVAEMEKTILVEV